MSDYIGLLVTGVGTIVFVLKDPWDKKILNTKLTLGFIGVLLLVIGIVITGFSTYNSNVEKADYKNQLDTIDSNIQKTFLVTLNGFDSILKEYENKTNQLIYNFSENYNTLISTIIEQSDSTLKAQLKKIKDDYQNLNQDYLFQKGAHERYYYSETWPISDKNQAIRKEMAYFIPIRLSSFFNGTDRFIIWYLMNNNGNIPESQWISLQDSIWNYIQPMNLDINANFILLEKFGVIKPEYMENNIVQFTDEFMERLNVYKNYKGTDQYYRKLFEIDRKYK